MKGEHGTAAEQPELTGLSIGYEKALSKGNLLIFWMGRQILPFTLPYGITNRWDRVILTSLGGIKMEIKRPSLSGKQPSSAAAAPE